MVQQYCFRSSDWTDLHILLSSVSREATESWIGWCGMNKIRAKLWQKHKMDWICVLLEAVFSSDGYSSAPLDCKGYQSAFLNRPLVLLLFFLVSLTSYYSNLLFCCCSITGHFYRVVCVIPHINSTCFVLLSSLCHYYIGNCYIVMPPFFFFISLFMFVLVTVTL